MGVKEKDIFCVLGNHDIDWNISKLGDGDHTNEKTSEVIKKNYHLVAASSAQIIMNRIKHNYVCEGPAPFSGVEEREEFIAFILNTGWCCTHDQKFSHGKLDQIQLEWFDEASRSYKDDDRIKIILMHHHPFNYSYPIPGIDISTVEEGAEIMEIAARNKIDIIVHGHRHHPHIDTIQINSNTNPITMICAGSLSVNADHRNNGEIPNTVHFLDIDKNKDYQVIHNFKFTEASGWEPIDKCSRETPLDYKMKTGKIFTSEEINQSILKYKDMDTVKLCWTDLDECLQFLLNHQINEKFNELLKNTHDVVGEFPQEIVLLKKRGRR